jgi:hypothetical protein
MLIGGASEGLHSVENFFDPEPAHVVVQPARFNPLPLWSPKPQKPFTHLSTAGSSSGMKLKLHFHSLHFRLHHRIGGYWTRRMFRGAFRGLFSGW